MANRPPLTPEEEWRYAQTALSWYGWGSPIGLGLGLVVGFYELAKVTFRGPGR